MNQEKTNSTFQFIYTAVIAGLLSGIVKLGWEVMFPPRTPERNATNPLNSYCNNLAFHKILHIKPINFQNKCYRGSASLFIIVSLL